MNYSELIRQLASVAEDYATTLGIDPQSTASRAANDVPADYRGDAVKEFRRACETTARKIDNGARLDKPGLYVLKVFRGNLGGPAPRATTQATTDPFVAETIREIEEADAELARMPAARHERVRAIERWRNERFVSGTGEPGPSPNWALYGFTDEVTYLESSRKALEHWRDQRGIHKPQPAGTQSLATVVQHSQTLRTLSEANDLGDYE